MATLPELEQIIAQVTTEVAAMIASGETGEVTVYVGLNQLQIEAKAKRKQSPIKFERGHAPLIRRVR